MRETPVTVKCVVPRGNPPVDLSWTMEGVDQSLSASSNMEDKFVLMQQLSVTRFFHSKSLICSVRSQTGLKHNSLSCAIGPFLVNYSPVVELQNPEVTLRNDTLNGTQIQCSAHGYPEITKFHWTCMPRSIILGCEEEGGDRLMIFISRESPYYKNVSDVFITCGAFNLAGYSSASIAIPVSQDQTHRTPGQPCTTYCLNLTMFLEVLDVVPHSIQNRLWNIHLACFVTGFNMNGSHPKLNWYVNGKYKRGERRNATSEENVFPHLKSFLYLSNISSGFGDSVQCEIVTTNFERKTEKILLDRVIKGQSDFVHPNRNISIFKTTTITNKNVSANSSEQADILQGTGVPQNSFLLTAVLAGIAGMVLTSLLFCFVIIVLYKLLGRRSKSPAKPMEEQSNQGIPGSSMTTKRTCLKFETDAAVCSDQIYSEIPDAFNLMNVSQHVNMGICDSQISQTQSQKLSDCTPHTQLSQNISHDPVGDTISHVYHTSVSVLQLPENVNLYQNCA